jgi:hypothetical protein
MSMIQEGGKVASGVVAAMASTPLALALLVVNAAFIAFFGYLISEVSTNARARDISSSELIKQLISDCSGSRVQKPSIKFRAPSGRAVPIDTPAPEPTPEPPAKAE